MLASLFVVILSSFSLNGFNVGGGYLCEKGKVDCLSSELPKSELWTTEIEEREALISSGVCRNEFQKHPGLDHRSSCKNRSNRTNDFDDWEAFKERNCFCDKNCPDYDDCCGDYVFPKDAHKSKDFSCTKLPNPGANYHLYTIQRCPQKWEGGLVRDLCEREAAALQDEGKYFTHLQAIPVHSAWTNLFYRNVYCAACNNDIGLTKWETHVHCNGMGSWEATDSYVDFSVNATYDPKKNNWTVRMENSIKTCRLVFKDLENWKKLLGVYQARKCKPAIDKCPPDANPYHRQKCQAYTSFVYEKRPTNGKLKAIYKNFHCALCNGAAVQSITCLDPTDLTLRTPTPDPKDAYLILLFDFNFFDEQDNQVGSSFSLCTMHDGQIWDPLLRTCLNITCGKSFKRVENKCVRITAEVNGTKETLDFGCLKIVLPSNLFVVMENNSIYVNYSGRIYHKSQYEVHKEKNGIVLEVLICAEEREQVQFFPGLEWLSEIVLSISIGCLVVHIFVYAILPKLRNLPGKILMSLSSSLLCGHLFLLIGSRLNRMNTACHIVGIITHYSYLSAFCWMCVMGFDIHSTFSASIIRTSSSRFAFLKYSLFGWLVSLSVVAVATIVDYTAPESAFSPKYGTIVCWINQRKALLIFFCAPVAILLLANLIFFIITALSIRKVSKQTRMVNKFSEKVRYYLYVKLAVVLGLTWMFGFLAAILRIGALWYPFVILNGLQGALIFCVFTMKKKVAHMLVVKLRLRSHKYRMTKDSMGKKALYSSLSNLTTLQTTLTSTVAPVLSGSPEILKAVRRIESKSSDSKL